ITTFEPRLSQVHVTLEPPRPHDRTLRFRVEAVLLVEPAPEPVTFDTLLRLNTQEYVVQS
ncbi:MAG: type VI secretion system baseplate subunit TssE, partial [Candidatus Entotheonellia bacterium]